ncbi:MAG: hypothetical protein A3E37_02070 [Candidatus Andersenbacteria bacterium RIFCSPHIGHO2_12_FULL_46_9]|nr:MAG: hypothetical protein A3B76_01920 [Candidatus Andersenbacteria bacterium RIFCSPHIGHO2_02_FULL_46_16]OGY37913.1 MAG: hypothetical protein A3E37_02070 [Candidatus Andersenbacteria bacterium RIFCSPHIGHO2_12_FULL_46_9]OGY41485.1 MAG: hypothetical protein A3G57_00645 [Candidatus Andersenbacteria bacterium RIFCSPLOWO2_12_FULL_45_8]
MLFDKRQSERINPVWRQFLFSDARDNGVVSKRPKRKVASSGFTIIEVLVATFVIGTAIVGLFGLFALGLRLAGESENRLIAIALANEKMELIRNLPYVDVGTAGGIPAGTIVQEESMVRNNVNYLVKTDIRYVDDPYDGVASGGGTGGCVAVAHTPPGQSTNCNDLCVNSSAVNAHLMHGDVMGNCDGTYSGPDVLNTDYKQVRVEVSWPSPNEPRPILLITKVAPNGVEGGELFGTLDFLVINSQGLGVTAANVSLINSEVDPAVNYATQTNSEGRVVVPGLPEGAQNYKLMVSKSDHTTEQTFDVLSDFIPDPDHTHLSMLIGEVTQKTFVIDLASSLQITFEEGGDSVENYCEGAPPQPLAAIDYSLRGTKTIGMDDVGDPVYVYDYAGASDANGQSNHENLVWDTYELDLVDGVVCDIKETSLIRPVTINPGEDLAMTVKLVKHTEVSLHVTVVDTAGLAVDNATVRLIGDGADETLGTGPWGQILFADLPANDQFVLIVQAPGYAEWQDNVDVEGTSLVQVVMSSL